MNGTLKMNKMQKLLSPDPRITAIFAVVEQKAGNKKRAKELIARAKINGLVPDRIKTWLRGQPAAIKLIEQINEIDPF